MNYLAHAYLSPPDPYMLLGNLWGDLLKPRDYNMLPGAMQHGIQLHKHIDKFTDAHGAVSEMVHLIRPFQGKYTPVVTDVLMDYMLSLHWPKYHTDTIEVFCDEKYTIVEAHLELLPDRLHPRILRMLGDRWLESCKNRTRMQRTFQMLSHRASFQNNIASALEVYDEYDRQLNELFLAFFEDLREEINLRSAG